LGFGDDPKIKVVALIIFEQLSCCKFLKFPYEIVSNFEKEKNEE
jgi:hypothetical protein